VPGFTAKLETFMVKVQCALHHRYTHECGQQGTAHECQPYWYIDGFYEEFVMPSKDEESDGG
jgi:hypothetical protein